MDIKSWLIKWFHDNTGHGEEELERHSGENYFVMGYIDSFAFIDLISDIEEKFEVEIDNDYYADRSFSTIDGMAKIVEEIVQR